MNRDRVNQAINQIIKLFESGKLPEAVARTYIRRAAGDQGRPSDKWSLGNQIIMLLNGTTDARGIRQWNKVGRRVKRGAKAFYILAPVFVTRTVVKYVIERDPETGEEVERTVEEQERVLVGFRGVPVFRREDTEPIPGREVKEPDYRPAQLPPLYEVAQRLGVKVEWAPMDGKPYWGYYDPARNKIKLHTHDVFTFFHELAHAAHHRVAGQIKGGQDPAQEIVAETVALTLCRLYGYEGWEPHAYRYIRHYTQDKNPARAIMNLLGTIQKVLDFILGVAQATDSEAEEASVA